MVLSQAMPTADCQRGTQVTKSDKEMSASGLILEGGTAMADEQLLAILTQGVDAWNQWRAAHPFRERVRSQLRRIRWGSIQSDPRP